MTFKKTLNKMSYYGNDFYGHEETLTYEPRGYVCCLWVKKLLHKLPEKIKVTVSDKPIRRHTLKADVHIGAGSWRMDRKRTWRILALDAVNLLSTKFEKKLEKDPVITLWIKMQAAK